MNTTKNMNTSKPATVEAKETQFKAGDVIRWTEEDNSGKKTYPTGEVVSVQREHPAMKAFYEVKGLDWLVREDCARSA